MQVLFHHRRIHAQHAAGHGVARVLDLDLRSFQDHLDDFLLEVLGPQLRVFQLDLVDDVYAEVQVHGLIAQDVLELLRHAGHLVATPHGENLCEAAVKENAFSDCIEPDQVSQQLLVGFGSARMKIGIAQRMGMTQAPGRFLGHRGDFPVHIEHLAFVHTERFDTVLIGMGVYRLFEGLPQQVLAALRVCDVPVYRQHQVVRHE